MRNRIHRLAVVVHHAKFDSSGEIFAKYCTEEENLTRYHGTFFRVVRGILVCFFENLTY